jgi:hypothetical protein
MYFVGITGCNPYQLEMGLISNNFIHCTIGK